MSKVKIIAIVSSTVVLLLILSYFLRPTLKVKNEKYHFVFTYSNYDRFTKDEEVDNNYIPDKDGIIYRYNLRGPFAGSFTKYVGVTIFAHDIDTFLKNDSRVGYEIQDVEMWGYKAKKYSLRPGLGGGSGFCYYLIPTNSMLYVISCNVKVFKFL